MASLINFQKPTSVSVELFQKLIFGKALKPIDCHPAFYKSTEGRLSFIARASDPDGGEYTTFVKLPDTFAIKEKSIYFITWHGGDYDLSVAKGFFKVKETKGGGVMYLPSISN